LHKEINGLASEQRELRVLALGGAGDFGLRTTRLLAANDIVSEIAIGGRSLEKVKAASAAIGAKAKATVVDISDHDKLVSMAKEFDLVLNMAGPEWEVVLKVLKASIEAGTNYCDLCAHNPTIERALELDAEAKASGVIALMGMGGNPGLTSLMMAHASNQVGDPTEVLFCDFYAATAIAGWKDRLTGYVDANQPSAAWKMIMKWATPPFRVFHDGALKSVRERASGFSPWMPGNDQIQAVEIGGIEHITIPRSKPGIRNVHTLVSWFPFGLNESYREIGARSARGELDDSQATLEFVKNLIKEVDRGQKAPTEYLGQHALWAEAMGFKDGRRTKYTCRPTSFGWLSTAHALATGTMKILNGEVKSHGVLTPESCFEPLGFFRDGARSTLNEEPAEILNESWQTI
jgi:short subunit dehydrogenase-like uncharacterized protein